MTKNNKQYDLEDRTYKFAVDVRKLIKRLQKTVGNIEDGKQLVRSSGSVAANYIEANEALSKKDFGFRVKIARKEVKESRLWLQLLDCDEQLQKERERLIQESTELLKILNAIVQKV